MKKGWMALGFCLLSVSCTLFDELLSPGDISKILTDANDTVPPVITVVSPTNGEYVDQACTITMSILEEGSGVGEVNISFNQVSWNKASFSGGVWTGNLNLPVGSNTIYLYAADKKANYSATNTLKVIAVTPAVFNMTYPVNSATYYNTIGAVQGNAGLSAPQTIQSIALSVNDGGFITVTNTPGTNSLAWSFSVDPGDLVFGMNTLQARLISSSGKSTLSPLVSFTLIHQETNVFYHPNGTANSGLGWSIAVTPDGNTIVAGAPKENSFKGAVYRYHWNGSTWITNRFVYANLVDGDRLGVSIAVSADGNTIICGAVGDDIKDSEAGAVYRFHYDGAKWISNKFYAFDGADSDSFGISVAVSSNGNTFIVGAFYKNSSQGAVYRFHWTGSEWLTNKFVSFDSSSDAHFGWAVAMTPDGNTFAASAPFDDENGLDSGAILRFNWTGSVWLTNKIIVDSITPSAFLGVGAYDYPNVLHSSSTPLMISPDGETIVAGAAFKDSNKGAAYRFVWNGASWNETQFSASDGLAGDYFGSSVAVSPDGKIIYAGAPGTDEPVTDAGAVYQFINSQ